MPGEVQPAHFDFLPQGSLEGRPVAPGQERLQQLGVFARNPRLGDMIQSEFAPVLEFDFGHAESLFHTIESAWYLEMTSAPPDHVD